MTFRMSFIAFMVLFFGNSFSNMYADFEQIVNSSLIQLISINDFMKTNSTVQYLKCSNEQSFCFEPFPLSVAPETQPHEGTFAELFILTIPHGRVCSENGWVVVDHCFMKELVWRIEQFGFNHIRQTKFENVKKISGRVAVIAQPWCGYYYHWTAEVLGRLALLEMNGIEYDWLYIQTDSPFMKESLALWGIDQTKIIDPFGDTHYIEADRLIVPSLVSRLTGGWTRFASYVPPQIIDYVKNKLGSRAMQHQVDFESSKRIFISRKDAHFRKMLNEDDVFALFKTKGFKRYDLSELTFSQQIQLFQNAEIIVAAHGAGLFNTVFCNSGSQIIEIFQRRCSATFWYLSQQLGLRHSCIKTIDFEINGIGASHTYVPLDIVQKIIDGID